LDGKIKKDFTNVLKTVIFSLQVGFTSGILSLTLLSNCVFGSSNFKNAFWIETSYWIGNLMRIPKPSLNLSFQTPSGFNKQFCS